MAQGQAILLEQDAETRNRERYGRRRRYVYLPDGRMLNAEIIAQGYGFAVHEVPVHAIGRVPATAARSQGARARVVGR